MKWKIFKPMFPKDVQRKRLMLNCPIPIAMKRHLCEKNGIRPQ
jgi:hypothetical protein